MMKKFNRPVQENYSTEGWMSFSDIMTGLLFIFLLIIMTMMYLLQDYIVNVNSKIKEPEEKTHAIMDLITDNLRINGINVSVDKTNNVIHILDSELKFRSGEYSIQYQYLKTVRKLAHEIDSALRNNAYINNQIAYIDSIFIEGHTHKVFYNNSRLFDNWGLSTLRAVSVWNAMNVYSQKRLEKYKHAEGKPLFSVSGYAECDLIHAPMREI